ncbi:hypothetical protein GPJ56_008332 [Histomonas meleagridis]|uniref:uncharacterized protein n=1 Tax=Histomonas meleagridis TaxID=135588 RepID=UPI003559C258|nr:hypothetical protein GPJ56_008332 [Histomonas meleagridis]KAH0806903.1 hypothetical protein GO595_000079 [Histomonas meleagridis]
MNVKWSEPVQQVLSKSEVTVSEKRNFDFDSNPIKISSTISTNFKYLKATIIRTLTDSNNNCTEDISINIIYSGDCYKKEIERSFFLALQPLIITEAKAPLFADNASLEHFQIYHNLHDELEQLKNLSSSFNNIIEQTKIDRKPLVVPSADQISQIINIVSYEKFSIQDEIDQMRAETDRMNRIVGSIKKARQQTIGSSSLPIFIMASCAALIAIVISRSKK